MERSCAYRRYALGVTPPGSRRLEAASGLDPTDCPPPLAATDMNLGSRPDDDVICCRPSVVA